MYYKMQYESPVGEITLVGKEHALVGAWLAGQKYYLGKLTGNIVENRDVPVLREAAAWLDGYFAGERQSNGAWPDGGQIRLEPEGSAFQCLVWRLLCEIPYGEVVTYGELAKRVARELGRENMAAQAVGSAVGHNPISIIIPCHRVIGAGGTLTGYAGGLSVKEWLLNHEGSL